MKKLCQNGWKSGSNQALSRTVEDFRHSTTQPPASLYSTDLSCFRDSHTLPTDVGYVMFLDCSELQV